MRAKASKAHEALVKAHRHILGRSDESRLKRNEERASLSRGKGSAGFGHENVLGIALGTNPKTRSPQVNLFVRRKVSLSTLEKKGARAFPSSFGGLPAKIIKAALTPGLSMGDRIQVSGGESHDGTFTGCVRSADSRLWLVSCAHVLALLSDPPVRGASVICKGQPIGSLSAWIELTTGDTFDADVAIAKPRTGLSPITTWPDGQRFGDTGSMPATGSSVTLFSPIRPAGIQARVAGPRRNVTLALPDAEPVTYLNQVPLCAIDGGIVVDFRDSGTPVRDVNGLLVGMVIARSEDGKTAWCTPWPAVQARIDELASLNG